MKLLLVCLLFAGVIETNQHDQSSDSGEQDCKPLQVGVDSSAGSAVIFGGISNRDSVSISCPKGEKLLDNDGKSHCKVKLTCKDGKYVSNGLSAKQLKEVHCGCKPKLVSLTEKQVIDYLPVYTGINQTTFASFGDVEFIPKGNGFVITCQCAGAGDTCYLDLGKDYQTYMDKSSKYIYSVNKGGSGQYDLLTSAFITCDENGNNQLVDENGEKVPIGMYACNAEYEPFLAFQELLPLVSPSQESGAQDWPIVIEANESSPLSVNIVCTCGSSTGSCVLALSGAYSRTKTGKDAKIKSPKIIVDANGKFKVDQSAYGSGGAFYKIKCYSK
uniref:Uncharacterized protein n=1 Tax=Plectus sambesii TaxID=2011161 RepID=A0A914VHJ7_9BILA